MPTMTQERVKEIADILLRIRMLLTNITAEEITEVVQGLSRDEAIGPLLDPTKWRDEDLFSQSTKSKRFLECLFALKNASALEE